MRSIVVIGPAGCGKSRNAPELARALKRKHWCELDRHAKPPRNGYVILANELTPEVAGLEAIAFSDAVKLLDRPTDDTGVTV